MDQNDIHSGEDYVFIRKFGTVSEFITGVRSLDTVLENISSFSTEVRYINNQGDDTPFAFNLTSVEASSPYLRSKKTNLLGEEVKDDGQYE